MRLEEMLLIVGMAGVSYGTRATGMWLARRAPLSSPIWRWLEQLPGTVLVALTVPAAAEGGTPDVLAGLVAAGAALATGSLFITTAAGVLAAILLRAAIVG